LGRIVFLHFLQKKGWMGCSPKTKDWIDGEPRFMQQLFEDFSKPEKFQSQCLTKFVF
jgi:adenine-specific DNA-methyltransferase